MGTTLILVVGGIVLIGFALKKYFERNKDYWKKRGVPEIQLEYGAIKGWYLLMTRKKNAVEFDVDNYNSVGEERYKGTTEIGKPVLVLKDLELIRQVLVKDFDHFVDRRKMELHSEPVLNQMVSLLEGQEWKDVRSVMSPTFTSGKIRRMFEMFNNSGTSLVEFIKTQSVGSPGTRDIVMKEFVSRYLIDVIAATAFGMETSVLKDKDSVFYKMGKRASEFSFLKLIKTVVFIFFPFVTKFGVRLLDPTSTDFFEKALRNTLLERTKSKVKREDFLQLLIETRKGELKTDETELEAFEKDAQLKGTQKEKINMSDDMMLGQCLVFFLAGLDTTGAVLCFAYYLLALHPDIQDKLYEEVNDLMKNNGGKVSYEAIGKMEYMDKFISEILRMYPPGTRIERRCTRPYTIPGTTTTIEKDILVSIPVIGLHRDPKLYPNPEKFDPERFSPEEKAKRTDAKKYSYLPFGEGPRNFKGIGMRFALMEAKVGIAYIVYNFFLEPNEKTPIPIKVDPNFGARPDVSVELRFKERIHD